MDKGLGFWLQRAARLQQAKVAEALVDLGLFAGQERALLALHAEKDLSVSELARMLGTRTPTASKTLARLASQGLVERDTADPAEPDADRSADRKGGKATTKKAGKGAKAKASRSKGPSKGRNRARLTAEGTRRAKILAGRMDGIEESLLAPLDDKDGRRLRKLLRKVARSMSGGGIAPETDDDG